MSGSGMPEHPPVPVSNLQHIVVVVMQNSSFDHMFGTLPPPAKQNYVSRVRMDHVSILRFIQNNWGLAPLNTRNSQSNDLSDLFQ